MAKRNASTEKIEKLKEEIAECGKKIEKYEQRIKKIKDNKKKLISDMKDMERELLYQAMENSEVSLEEMISFAESKKQDTQKVENTQEDNKKE